MHSVEHMFATYVRSSAIGDSVIYFGPMGCQTGFYLLVRDRSKEEVLEAIVAVLRQIISHTGEMFGAKREECGNYLNLDIVLAKRECQRYLDILLSREQTFEYGGENE